MYQLDWRTCVFVAGAQIICLIFIRKSMSYLWSIQTELERDRERELELNQYYFDPFTLQLEWDLELNWDHIVLL